MLFNSYPFILVFLPLALAGFFTLGRWRRDWAISWLILISLGFYGWWRPLNILIIAPSILINYVLARVISQSIDVRPRTANIALISGIVFNLCFLGYFKYLGFSGTVVNGLFGSDIALTTIILPLGISFITFQKIAFLVDVHAGRVKSFNPRDYTIFVLFFPQLVAGPIVHYQEMVPQFHSAPCRFRPDDIAIGIVLFSFGLFKKAVLADSVAAYVSPIYVDAAQGGQITLFYAWIAALGFTVQIYFDFAGYSEMALGLARFFGIKLPANFNSPLKAASIIEFWQRWHITLTRFLTAYLYNPMTIALTRRRMAKRLPVASGRNTSFAVFASLVAFPTLVTFLACGLWHGAGYQFIIWGLMHGIFLTINQGWRLLRRRYLWLQTTGLSQHLLGCVLTFLSIVGAIVIFRASTLAAGVSIWKGMLGLNGVAAPQGIFNVSHGLARVLNDLGVVPVWSSGYAFIASWAWIGALLVVIWTFPNVLEVLRRHEPALGISAGARGSEQKALRFEWRPTTAWAIGVSAAAAAGILSLGLPSEFLYWQF